jgi:hypothetical protein
MRTSADTSRLARWLLILLLSQSACLLTGCGYLAAGAVGGAIGHEIAEDDDDDD